MICDIKEIQKVKMAVGNEKKSEAETKLVVDYTTNNNSNIFILFNLCQRLF